MPQSLKVFFSCALGAFIGSLVALQVSHNFWWVGLIAGFGVGYLTYKFEKVKIAIPIAWQHATAWKPDWERWSAFLKTFCYATIIGSNITLGVSLLLYTLIKHWHLSDSMVMIFITFMFGYIFGLPESRNTEAREKAFEFMREYPIWKVNPIWMYLWVLPKFLAESVWWLVSRIPWGGRKLVSAIRIVGKFSWTLFKLIHSEIRLLCGLDAALGAAIGYYFGNALIGAFAGGILGVLNFEVISIRVLKLVPQTQSFFRN